MFVQPHWAVQISNLSQCTNPANNRVIGFNSEIGIDQNGSIIRGTGTFSDGPESGVLKISGTVTAGFDTMGSFTFILNPYASGSGIFTGASLGNTITLNLAGQVTIAGGAGITGGGTCTFTASASGNR
jgi:hypothetical protein